MGFRIFSCIERSILCQYLFLKFINTNMIILSLAVSLALKLTMNEFLLSISTLHGAEQKAIYNVYHYPFLSLAVTSCFLLWCTAP